METTYNFAQLLDQSDQLLDDSLKHRTTHKPKTKNKNKNMILYKQESNI